MPVSKKIEKKAQVGTVGPDCIVAEPLFGCQIEKKTIEMG